MSEEELENRIQVGREINILSGKIKRSIDKSFSGTELTGVQSKVMHFIYCKSETGDVFQKDISERFSLRRSTATEILGMIEKAGMIKRVGVEYDARLKKIVLTDKAMELKQKLCENIAETEIRLTSGISQKELDSFLSTIGKMIGNLDD